MRNATIAIALAAALPFGLAAGGTFVPTADAQEFVRIGTAGSGGNFYRLGGGLASIWNDEVEGVRATIQATGGTVENLDLLADREVEVAYLSGSLGQLAYENEGMFADRPEGRYQGLRAIGTVYPNPHWFIAIDSSIQNLRDLRGKRVSVGMQGSQGEAVWRQIMEQLGWTYDDITAEYTVHQAAIDQVRNRQVDAIVWGDAPGSASIQEIIDTGFGRVLDFDEDVIEYMDAQGLDYPYTMPAGSVPGTDQPMRTFAAPVTFVTHDGVSDDLVYELTKAMFEHKDRLVQVHPLAEYMTLENALDGLPFPLHPGAERFYQEQGVM